MKREEQWKEKYDNLWKFVSENHRGPSRHRIEEKDMLNWLKYNRKLLNRDALPPERKKALIKLKALITSFHRVNQYC